MKKLIILMFAMMFMLSFASAWQSDKFELDQNKIDSLQTKTNYGKYIIEKSSWYDPLQIWTKERIKDVVLEENTDSCGQDCYMITDIENLEESSLVDDIRFYRMYEDGSQSLSNIRSYQFYIQTGGSQIEVDDYEWKCVDAGVSKNGTKIQDCNNVLVGSHLEDSPEWTPYSIGEVMPTGNYTIKLEGNKRPSWSYDWQIKIGGSDVWTDKWAVWEGTSGITTPINYYKLDESSGDVIDEIQNLNGTNSGGLTGVTGKINDAYNFTGSSSSISFTANSIDNIRSYSFWVKPDVVTSSNMQVIYQGTASVFDRINLNDNYILFESAGSAGSINKWNATTTPLTTGNWYFIVVTTTGGDSGDTEIYINNVLQSLDYSNLGADRTRPSGSLQMKFGDGYEGSYNAYSGFLDEVGIFNQSLSVSEVSTLYNSGTGLSYPFVEGTVTLNSPADASISQNAEVQYNATATVTGGATLVNMSLCNNETGSWVCGYNTTDLTEIKDDIQQTDTPDTLNIGTADWAEQSFQITSEEEGSKELNRIGLYLTTSSNVKVSIRSNRSGSDLVSDSLASTTTNDWNYFDMNNYSLEEASTYHIVVRTNSGSATIKQDLTGSYPDGFSAESSNSGSTWNDFAEEHDLSFKIEYINTPTTSTQTWNRTIADTILWNVQACDSDGDCGFATSNFTVSLDSTAPSITILSPTGVLESGQTGEVEDLNVTITDSNLDSCWYNYNGTNTTLASCENTTITLEDYSTSHSVTVYANDTVGNEGSETSNWNYKLFGSEFFYDSPVLETSQATITVQTDILSGFDVQNATLNYSETIFSATAEDKGSNVYNISSTFTVPSGTEGFSSENRSFYYDIRVRNTSSGVGTQVTTDSINQTVNELVFGLCGGAKDVPMLNFTMFDEETGNEINATANATTFQATFLIGANPDSLTKNVSVNNQSVNTNEFDFCGVNDDDVIYADLQSLYTAQAYTEKDYFLDNATLTNDTNEVSLYLLLEDNAIEFFINVKDGLDAVTDANINIQKYFVGEGVYKTVEIDQTDDDGQITAFLELDREYKFTVTKGGEILIIKEVRSTCDAAPCELEIVISSDVTNPYNEFSEAYAQNVLYNLSYNAQEKVVLFDFVDTTGLANYFRMKTFRTTLNNGSVLVDNQQVFSSAGTITFNLSSEPDGDYRVETYISRSPEKLIDFINFVLTEVVETLGVLGLFVSLILVLIVIFGLAFSPSMLVMAVPLSFTVTKLMGLVAFSWTSIVVIYILAIAATFAISR